jgi:phosphoglycerol transferase MdoB-like AlkP superfamily enzyme
MPHSPYVFGPNGEEIIPKTLQLGEKHEIDKTGYLGQLQYTNKLLQDTIQEILLKNEIPPIIVLQGDHGSGEVPGWQNLETEALKERHSNFVAIYLPESDESIFYETITPVNIFRLILKNNFGDDYSLLEDKMYGQDPNSPWKFINVTKIVLED